MPTMTVMNTYRVRHDEVRRNLDLLHAFFEELTAAIGLAQDLKAGIIDRFRNLPMSRSAVLAGRTVADLVRSVTSVSIMIGLGLLVGFRFDNSAAAILAGIGLVLLFGYAFSWVYATIGLVTGDTEAAQVAGILPPFVLMFASNAVVPVQTMPGWLQGFANNQQLSVTITASRHLFEGGAAAHFVVRAIAWSLGIIVVFFTISLHLYRSNRS